MNTQMRPLSRILVALASLAMTAAFFLPVWFIFLLAPQYPEGLTMYIWLDHLGGQVDIINGLNHYIGMKHISAEMFPEFGYLKFIVGAFVLIGLAVAISGRRKLLFAFLLLLAAAAAVAMYDFYSWGYDYGHHLDPKAAIQVPGLFYQPPVIGHKTLLNFDAYSYPDTGGWIVIGAGILCFAVWIYERYGRRASKAGATLRLEPRTVAAALVFTAGLLLTSCSPKPEPFVVGRDMCADCKMAVMDLHFGAELITAKGRIYKFDDLHCLQHYLQQQPAAGMGAQVLVADHEHPGTLLPIESAWALTDAAFKSPMNSNTAFFTDETTASRTGKEPVAACKILKL